MLYIIILSAMITLNSKHMLTSSFKQIYFRANGVGSTAYPPYPPLLSSLYNLTLPSLPDNRYGVNYSSKQSAKRGKY